MDLYSLLIQLLNSIQYGLLLFLVASGLTLIFGIMGVINLAHGSFYMIGAYMAFTLSSLSGSFFVAIVAGIALSVGLGVASAYLRYMHFPSNLGDMPIPNDDVLQVGIQLKLPLHTFEAN